MELYLPPTISIGGMSLNRRLPLRSLMTKRFDFSKPSSTISGCILDSSK